ncbi:MAG: energy-coupling factor ABC transporter permease, partial [Acidaminobacteraceae bacterium]
SEGMHIMEGFLPKEWALFWFAVFIPFFLLGFRKVKRIMKKDKNTKLLLGLCAAFVFVLSALKIPSVTGSTSHPTGVGLGAILFGPLTMSVLGLIVLIFQATLLAHGGLSTIGANGFSMAVAGPFISYFVFIVLKKFNVNRSVTVFLAAFIGDLGTYMVTSIQLGLAFPDPTLGVMVSVTKFLSIFAFTQVPIAIAEGILTVMIYNFITENFKKESEVLAYE